MMKLGVSDPSELGIQAVVDNQAPEHEEMMPQQMAPPENSQSYQRHAFNHQPMQQPGPSDAHHVYASNANHVQQYHNRCTIEVCKAKRRIYNRLGVYFSINGAVGGSNSADLSMYQNQSYQSEAGYHPGSMQQALFARNRRMSQMAAPQQGAEGFSYPQYGFQNSQSTDREYSVIELNCSGRITTLISHFQPSTCCHRSHSSNKAIVSIFSYCC